MHYGKKKKRRKKQEVADIVTVVGSIKLKIILTENQRTQTI